MIVWLPGCINLQRPVSRDNSSRQEKNAAPSSGATTGTRQEKECSSDTECEDECF